MIPPEIVEEVLKSRFSTVGILKYMVGYCDLSGKSMSEAISVHNLHPPLAAAFGPEANVYSVADRGAEGCGSLRVSLVDGASLEDIQKRVHDRYIAESRLLDSVALPSVLRAEFNPILKRIDALLRPVMDRAEIRKVVKRWRWP